jgi:hypothetical protein
MCNYSGKLIAWLDQELPENHAADVDQHVRGCGQCQRELDSYRRVSRAVDAYCDAAMTSRAQPRLPRWIPVLSGGVAAGAVALVLTFPRMTVQQPAPLRLPTVAVPADMASASGLPEVTVSNPISKSQAKRSVSSGHRQPTIWTPAERAVQIAIPAEAMFPPGAVPEGVNFTADLSIGADGSVQQLRLRPQLVGFERRLTHP